MDGAGFGTAHANDTGVSPSGKAAGFDPAIRRFESFHPSHTTQEPAGRRSFGVL